MQPTDGADNKPPQNFGHALGTYTAKGIILAQKKRVLLVAFVTVFLDLMGFGIIIPIQPFYAELLGAGPAVVTLLGGSYSLMQFLFAPFWGRLSDRIGRRPIILLGVASSVVGYVIFGFAETLLVLFASRLLTGFGNANIGAAQAIIADVTDESNRAKGMGLIGAAFGLGFIFGPAIGGIAGQYGPTYPAFVAAAFGVINFLLAWFLLPETNTNRNSSTHGHKRLSLDTFREAKKTPFLISTLCLTLLTILAFALMEQIVGLFIERTWVNAGTTTTESMKEAAKLTSVFLVAVGVTATIVQGGLIGRISKRLGDAAVIKISLVFLTISMLTTPYLIAAKSWGLLMLAGAILAGGMGLFNPSSTAYISKLADKDNQGSALGWNQSMASLGRVIGPSIAGTLFSLNMFRPFQISAIIMLVALFMSLRLPSSHRP